MKKQGKSPKLAAIVGATGSGKTESAVKLARRFDGVVVSADSRQTYRGLDIGTNKVGQVSSYHGRPSRIIDGVHQLVVDCAVLGVRFTLSDWLREARSAIDLICQNGQLPIVAGGTGLYVSALLEGYDLPDRLDSIDLDLLPLSALQSLVSPDALSPSDYVNPIRLKNYLLRLDRPKRSPKLSYDSRIYFLKKDRDDLAKKASQRFEDLVDEIVREIDALISQGVSKDFIDSLGLDYRYALSARQDGRGEAIVGYRRSVRQFIRRQETWWRHHGEVVYATSYDEIERDVERFLKDS